MSTYFTSTIISLKNHNICQSYFNKFKHVLFGISKIASAFPLRSDLILMPGSITLAPSDKLPWDPLTFTFTTDVNLTNLPGVEHGQMSSRKKEKCYKAS